MTEIVETKLGTGNYVIECPEYSITLSASIKKVSGLAFGIRLDNPWLVRVRLPSYIDMNEPWYKRSPYIDTYVASAKTKKQATKSAITILESLMSSKLKKNPNRAKTNATHSRTKEERYP